MCKAINVASWFINNDFSALNNKDSNLKLNKLLYFAQMISLIKRNKPLFEEDLYAFENGVVVEDIRKEYCNNYSEFIKIAKKCNYKIGKEEEEILNITKNIFMDASPSELSDLTHEHKCWQDYYKKSLEDAQGKYTHNKESAKIPIDVIVRKYSDDLFLVKEMVDAFEESEVCSELKITVNGIDYYYDPREISITEDIYLKLQEFPADDSAYTLYIDETQGLVIY